jgi:hypothetical protein
MFDLTPSSANPLSFEDAVQLFEAWGFRVEPGPQPDEVTLIIDAPDHRNYSVYPVHLLPAIAAVALGVRQRRKEACPLQQTTHPKRLRLLRKVR